MLKKIGFPRIKFSSYWASPITHLSTPLQTKQRAQLHLRRPKVFSTDITIGEAELLITRRRQQQQKKQLVEKSLGNENRAKTMGGLLLGLH